MSRGDVALRALEREAQGGDPAAEVRLLVARLRAGTLTRERVELAAWCASDAARVALGWPPCPEPEAPRMPPRRAPRGARWLAVDLAGFVAGLSRWADVGPVPGWVLVRAAVAAAWLAYRVALCPPRIGEQATATAARRAIEAAEAWLADPSEERRIAAARALIAADPVRRRAACGPRPETTSSGTRALWTGGLERCWLPTVPHRRCWLPTVPHRPTGGWGEETRGVWPSTGDDVEWNTRAVGLAARLAGEAPVRSAICSALTSWALETPA